MSREELEKRILEARYNLVSSKDKETIDILEELAIKALEQEPRKDEVILTKEEYGELVSSEFDNGYAKGYREALEDEPCVEPLERLAESASKTAKVLERLKVSEQEPMLDKVRAEIEGLTYYWCEINPKNVIDDVLEIIDKYRKEQE